MIVEKDTIINVCPAGKTSDEIVRKNLAQLLNNQNVLGNIREEIVNTYGEQVRVVQGSELSLDVTAVGWDKTYCLQYLDQYSNIYFFGDRCQEGGNDYELFSHSRVNGFEVDHPDHAFEIFKSLMEQVKDDSFS